MWLLAGEVPSALRSACQLAQAGQAQRCPVARRVMDQPLALRQGRALGRVEPRRLRAMPGLAWELV
jgi:hypothetical protein